MIKRLFEYLALGILAMLGLAKLRGKRVNPLALRVLLAILSFMAMCLGSSIVLLFAGTWLLFLLAGDAGRHFGVNLSLFVPVAEAVPEGVTEECFAEGELSDGPVLDDESSQFWKKCAQRCSSFFLTSDNTSDNTKDSK